MPSSSPLQRFSAAAALCLTASAAAAPPLRAPEVREQGYRLVIEQVQQQQYEQTDFPPGGVPESKGTTTGRQILNLKLAVYPPSPGMMANIVGLDQKIVASAGAKEPVTLRSWMTEEGPSGVAPWRSILMAQNVDLAARSLKQLQGELIVYPRAQLAILDFPIAKPGTTKTVDGFRTTLKSAKIRGNTLTVAVEMEWPTALSVTQPTSDTPHGITAVTKADLTLMPSAGSATNGDDARRVLRTLNLTFVDVKEPPELIRVERLVRSGGARRIKFTFPEIALPSSMEIEGDPSEAEAEPGPLEPSDPFFAEGGGTLVVPIHTRAAGRLMLGLSRVEGGAGGPWRWLLPSQERADRATLSSVKPGRYRVVRAWLPPADTPDLDPRATPARLGEASEVQVEAGGSITLPAIEDGGKR